MEINSNTALYCIFGNPAKHSISPIIHNYAFNEHKINALYLAFEVKSIKDAVEAVRVLNIAGASVTIPFKVDIMQYIDRIDPLSLQIGAVNTLQNKNGVIFGYNTDGDGALIALLKNGININNKTILLLGNGGSARSIAFSLLKHNAKIYIAGRDKQKIVLLAENLKKYYSDVQAIMINKIDSYFMNNIDIIINTTPVGMSPNSHLSPISPELIKNNHIVFDIIYYPEMTVLLKNASDKGCKIIKGLEMLIYQGGKQFEIWTGKKAPEDIILKKISDIFYGNKI